MTRLLKLAVGAFGMSFLLALPAQSVRAEEEIIDDGGGGAADCHTKVCSFDGKAHVCCLMMTSSTTCSPCGAVDDT